MKKVDITRIICLSASAVTVPTNASFLTKFIIKNIIQRIFKYGFEDMLKMETILQGSGLDWTVIRPPRLLNGDKTGKYRTGINEYLLNSSSINHSDLADYIIHHLEDEKTYKGTVQRKHSGKSVYTNRERE